MVDLSFKASLTSILGLRRRGSTAPTKQNHNHHHQLHHCSNNSPAASSTSNPSPPPRHQHSSSSASSPDTFHSIDSPPDSNLQPPIDATLPSSGIPNTASDHLQEILAKSISSYDAPQLLQRDSIIRTDSSYSGPTSTLHSSIFSHPSTTDAGMTDTTCPDVIIQQATPDTISKASSPQPALSRPPSIRSRSPETRKRGASVQFLPTVPDLDTRQNHPPPLDPEVINSVLQDLSEHRPNPAAIAAVRQVQQASQQLQSLPRANIMPFRKIWVKRAGAAPTIVKIKNDDLVDEVKDEVLVKYKNSLGRAFDAPDVTVRVILRDRAGERTLNPDETISEVLDRLYPNGQTIEEALIIDVPTKQQRSPRPSPRHATHQHHNYHGHERDDRPPESGTDYFPPMPMIPSPNVNGHAPAPHDRAMSVLNTGQVPPLPSPSATRSRTARAPRPGFTRQATTSPSSMAANNRGARPRLESSASQEGRHPIHNTIPQPPPMPTPPAPEVAVATSPRVQSPRPTKPRKAKPKPADPTPTITPNITVIDTAVPPINVLIVEDNHINMKLLEQFIRRLKVRWQTAVNGREAVDKWRQGGFHLVLMDIQLPIMSGLEATKEIRRLERANSIGVFSNSLSNQGEKEVISDEDKLADPSRLFKSPVIIVALTASNLNSDRHEALAAGCNDFLTKPVNFVWFERKVKEWGCMQALIDFDGWRNWKDFAAQNGLHDASGPSSAASKRPARKTIAKKADTPAAAMTVNQVSTQDNGEGSSSDVTMRGRPEGIMV